MGNTSCWHTWSQGDRRLSGGRSRGKVTPVTFPNLQGCRLFGCLKCEYLLIREWGNQLNNATKATRRAFEVLLTLFDGPIPQYVFKVCPKKISYSQTSHPCTGPILLMLIGFHITLPMRVQKVLEYMRNASGNAVLPCLTRIHSMIFGTRPNEGSTVRTEQNRILVVRVPFCTYSIV